MIENQSRKVPKITTQLKILFAPLLMKKKNIIKKKDV